MQVKDYIIHLLGGYTSKEYLRVERKYQALLDSKSNNINTRICNEYIYRTLRILDEYAKNILYGIPSNRWAEKMYNVIHNNLLRILIRYLNTESSIIYTLDITLENKDEFKKVIENE